MRPLIAFLFAVTSAVEVTQTSSFWTTSTLIDPFKHGQTLAITVTKASEATSLLVLVSQGTVSFSFDNYRWDISTQYQYIEGWALQNKKEFTMTIPSSVIQMGQLWNIGVFKDNEEAVEYDLDISTLSSDACSSDCGQLNSCEGGECQCRSSESRGENCLLSLTDLAFNNEYDFVLEAYEWVFYRLVIPLSSEKITFNALQRQGSPYIFVKRTPSDSSQVPSMFDYSLYLYFGEESEFSHSYQHNNRDYWLLSIYCESDSFCDFAFEITKTESDSEEIMWLMIALIIIVSVICFLVPIIIKIVIRLRRSRQTQPNATSILPADIEARFPTVEWKDLKKEETDPCTICLDDFTETSKVRELSCKHVFHVSCIDSWVITRPCCPLCKASIMPPATDNTMLALAPQDMREVLEEADQQLPENHESSNREDPNESGQRSRRQEEESKGEEELNLEYI